MSDTVGDSSAFEALLFLSFGGPERVEDVRPFLENVTRGRGVPPERFEEVVQHYLHFGGVSPINRLNLAMIDALGAELTRRGRDLPIYFGNRNWHPMAAEATRRIYDDGHRRVLVFPTSAWGGYSGCRQYHEDIAAALGAGLPADDPSFVMRKLPQFSTESKFIEAAVSAVSEQLLGMANGNTVALAWRNRTMWLPAARSHRATAVVSRARSMVELAMMAVALALAAGLAVTG